MSYSQWICSSCGAPKYSVAHSSSCPGNPNYRERSEGGGGAIIFLLPFLPVVLWALLLYYAALFIFDITCSCAYLLYDIFTSRLAKKLYAYIAAQMVNYFQWVD